MDGEKKTDGEETDDQAPQVTAAELPTRVTLRGRDGELVLNLVPPKSLALRYEVVFAVAQSEANAVAAALGLCSVTLRKHVRWNHDVHAFGAAVLDWLLERGVNYHAALRAGRVAWVHLRDGLVFEDEVKEAEGFTEPSSEESIS
ncbi:MAG: hypothetical protein ABMA64_07100 [Myxococcota bacterium]